MGDEKLKREYTQVQNTRSTYKMQIQMAEM